MLFNSLGFCLFLPIVFFLYWFVFNKTKNVQNIFLVLVSYIFYSFWNWHFSFILLVSTLFSFLIGILIHRTNSEIKEKWWMRFSVILNIAVLCYFKYANFFIESICSLFQSFGFQINSITLNIILPIGISFYTFHSISYILDIYYGRIKPTNNFIEYVLFVSYFPLLVAGPIERATHLLPQLSQKRKFSYQQSTDGIKLIVWGLFKKIVIADSLAPIVDEIFNNYQEHRSIELIIGTIGFAFQVYGDFSGYTDIARGVSKLLGIDLILNFNLPYFSRSIPEFWSRWHISLTSWMNDYVFTPLAFSLRKKKKWGLFTAVVITFAISGIWHGAGFNYLTWGVYYGLLFGPFIFYSTGTVKIGAESKDIITISDLPKILMTFCIICIGDVFFRSENFYTALKFYQWIFISDVSSFNLFKSNTQLITILKFTIGIVFLLFVEWNYLRLNKTLPKVIISLTLIILLFLGSYVNSLDFVYFQF